MATRTTGAQERGDFAALVPRRIRLPNGVELHHVREGRGPRLVFVHGAMGDWRSWEPQWNAFTPHFDCVSYSRRYSFPNANAMASPAHSALDEAQDLRLLLDALGWDDAIVVGASYGGFTGLALAVAHPSRVRALVAIEPPMMKYAEHSENGRAAAAAFRVATIAPANAAFRAGDDELAARIMTGGINGGVSPAGTPEQMRRRLQNVRAMKMLALSRDEFPLLPSDRLAALSMPVLLVCGGETQSVHRAIFDNVAAAMPQARSLVVPASGHGVARDQPSVFNAAVLGFLTDNIHQETP